MKIETKFSIGDKVYRLFKDHVQTVIACTVCNDSKQVEIKGTMFKCPNCERGTNSWKLRWFVHTEPTTVGQVSVQAMLKTLHSSNYFDESEIQGDEGTSIEQYMLSATGIGSGTLWNHNDIFLTLKEAQDEAGRRNDVLIREEQERPT